MTGMKLENLVDIDIHLFIKKGLRGWVSYIDMRYAKANDKYMKNHDPKKPSTFITYLDMNNLYGWAMSSYLPYGGFKWLKNVSKFVNSIEYIFKVDLEYPDQLHVLHNDYPLAPEKLAIFHDMLSDYCKKLLTNMK